MAESIKAPLSPLAPHNTPENSGLPPPPSHPLPPPAKIAAHAARREPTRPVDRVTEDGWYRWTGDDLPPPVQERNRNNGGVRSVRGETETQIPDATVQDSSSRGVKRIMRREKNAVVVRRAVVATRVATTLLCLVSFSILAADRHKGWALDSYDHYTQFRNEKHLIKRPAGNYFDFVMDQVLAYLLVSATSSASARVEDWIVNWGSDTFPNMANGSIAVSFLAFLAFALSSLLSAYNLFNTGF